VRLKSYKLHFAASRVRVVFEGFDGPGVDLLGEVAAAAFAHATGMLAWIDERERGMKARSMSVDLDKRRVLITFDVGGSRPVVVRVDEPASVDLIARGEPLERFLEARSEEAIRRRASVPAP